MGGCKCSYRRCKKSSDGKTHFFHYPVKNQNRCNQWIINSNREDFKDITIPQLRNKVVCEHHFPDNMFMNYKHDRLTHTAVPNKEEVGKLSMEVDISILLPKLDTTKKEVTNSSISSKTESPAVTDSDVPEINLSFPSSQEPKPNPTTKMEIVANHSSSNKKPVTINKSNVRPVKIYKNTFESNKRLLNKTIDKNIGNIDESKDLQTRNLVINKQQLSNVSNIINTNSPIISNSHTTAQIVNIDQSNDLQTKNLVINKQQLSNVSNIINPNLPIIGNQIVNIPVSSSNSPMQFVLISPFNPVTTLTSNPETKTSNINKIALPRVQNASAKLTNLSNLDGIVKTPINSGNLDRSLAKPTNLTNLDKSVKTPVSSVKLVYSNNPDGSLENSANFCNSDESSKKLASLCSPASDRDSTKITNLCNPGKNSDRISQLTEYKTFVTQSKKMMSELKQLLDKQTAIDTQRDIDVRRQQRVIRKKRHKYIPLTKANLYAQIVPFLTSDTAKLVHREMFPGMKHMRLV